MRRVFASCTCPVCSRRGRPIAYCEVRQREGGKVIACCSLQRGHGVAALLNAA